MPSLAQRVAGFGRLRERLGAGAAAHGLVLGRLALGLLHARRGFGRVPTMPAPFVCGLRMPGQYVLFGDEIAVSEHSARPLVAGERELVTLRADDETDTFWPVLTHMRVRGISNSAPAESSVAALDAPAPR